MRPVTNYGGALGETSFTLYPPQKRIEGLGSKRKLRNRSTQLDDELDLLPQVKLREALGDFCQGPHCRFYDASRAIAEDPLRPAASVKEEHESNRKKVPH